MDDDGKQLLGASSRLRLVCSFSKVAATVEATKQVLLKEPAVVLFASFVDVAKQVHRQLADSGWEGELLTGETPPDKRQPMVDRFQVKNLILIDWLFSALTTFTPLTRELDRFIF